ncbi:MAG: hypothetical protein QNJ97_25740 [Myxococcota bacterium]|nr:hypothetical protein [Myxococcota bacterium]
MTTKPENSENSPMKWIELIRVRSSAHSLIQAMPDLTAQVKEIDQATTDAETLSYRLLPSHKTGIARSHQDSTIDN